jgi:hypothetical protein
VRLTVFECLSTAVSAARIADGRLKLFPVLDRFPSIQTVHFHPVGFAVWTTVYSIPLCSTTSTSLYCSLVNQRSQTAPVKQILMCPMSYGQFRWLWRLNAL